MFFSQSDQERLIPLWRDYVGGKLGQKAVNQFIAATRKPPHWFADTILRPNLYRPGMFGALYLPVSQTKYSPGRNHILAEAIATDADLTATCGGDPLTGLTLFANTLRVWTPLDSDSDAVEMPMDRVVLGEHQVFTFEFDVPDPAFLGHQLSWLRSPKNPLDCPMGAVFRHCSGYADFVGLTVCYSGNKSLHIHIVFATTLAAAKLGLDQCPPADLRRGYAAHWERLHEDVLRILPTKGHRADRHLRFPESFRRIPNGSRVVEAGHLLGIPKGELLPQVTLWEKARQRASGDELPLFWSAEAFQATPEAARSRAVRVAAQRVGSDLTPEQQGYCEARLRERYGDWPRFDHLTYEGGRWVAKFRNSESDRTPSSIMREDHQRIHLVGRDAEGLNPKKLAFPLGTMLKAWCRELARTEKDGDGSLLLDDLLSSDLRPAADPGEVRFRANVTDGPSARAEMETFFRNKLPTDPLLMVVGPEGVGKTSVLMALHHEFVADLERRGENPLAMYAFADYAMAASKCDAFNEVQAANGFAGVLLPSFSRAYSEECERLRVGEITTEHAAKMNFPSRWTAIEQHQPQVMARFRERHAELWAAVGGKKPVFFVVHQVAHEWKKSTPTRLMWAPSFWNRDDQDPTLRQDQLRRETTLGLVVHDEVKAESLVHVHPAAVVRWVDEMVDSDTSVWCAKQPSLPSVLRSYEAFVTAKGLPVIDGSPHEITFEEARQIESVGRARWDDVQTKDTGEYGWRASSANSNTSAAGGGEPDHSIYTARHGRDWCVAAKGWWHGLADRVVLLTTEAVPAAVACAADPDWSVYELEAPLAARDEVEVHADRRVRGDNLATLCTEFRTNRPAESWFVVSNKVSILTDTLTHAGARGSNDLIGQNVVQTMTWMTPGEYEMLQALNAWTGRRDLVGLRHVDEFNQTAGRNLGFRRRGQVRHALLVNLGLFDVLLAHEGGVLGRARYGLRLMLDRDQRYEAVSRKKAA